jgi:general secretion pathway protein B
MPRADTDAPSASRATAAAAAPDSTEGATAENRTLPRSTASQSAVPDPTPAPVQTAMAITELPVSIQKDLPALSVMVHAYSDDPAKRLVGINNRLLHEGDEVAPGLKLETITLDGMILSYKGYTFRRGVR